jgi:hypothetical protein
MAKPQPPIRLTDLWFPSCDQSGVPNGYVRFWRGRKPNREIKIEAIGPIIVPDPASRLAGIRYKRPMVIQTPRSRIGLTVSIPPYRASEGPGKLEGKGGNEQQ